MTSDEVKAQKVVRRGEYFEHAYYTLQKTIRALAYGGSTSDPALGRFYGKYRTLRIRRVTNEYSDSYVLEMRS